MPVVPRTPPVRSGLPPCTGRSTSRRIRTTRPPDGCCRTAAPARAAVPAPRPSGAESDAPPCPAHAARPLPGSPHAAAPRGRRYPARAPAPCGPPPDTAPGPNRTARPPMRVPPIPLLQRSRNAPQRRRTHSPAPRGRYHRPPQTPFGALPRSNSSTMPSDSSTPSSELSSAPKGRSSSMSDVITISSLLSLSLRPRLSVLACRETPTPVGKTDRAPRNDSGTLCSASLCFCLALVPPERRPVTNRVYPTPRAMSNMRSHKVGTGLYSENKVGDRQCSQWLPDGGRS